MSKVDLNVKYIESLKTPEKRTEYFDKMVKGLCLRITEKGYRSWGLYFRFNNRLQRMTLGTLNALSLKDARKKARQNLNLVADGTNPLEEKKAARQADTFDFLASEYLERHAKAKKKSWKEDDRIITADLLPAFGGIKAKDVARRDVRALLERKAQTSPVMANRLRALLRKMFNWGISVEIVEDNPVLLVPLPTKAQQRDRVFTEEEIKTLWAEFDKEKFQTAAAFKLRLITAQRGAEVFSLEWTELDLETGWWTIPSQKTKNGLSHRVPLSAQSARILETLKEKQDQSKTRKGSPWAFPARRGVGHLTTLQKAVERIRNRSGIKDFRGHDLRRTAASMMTGMGIPRLVVSKVLNHVEPGVTAVYDRHSYDIEKREALETWSKRLTVMVSNMKEVKTENA